MDESLEYFWPTIDNLKTAMYLTLLGAVAGLLFIVWNLAGLAGLLTANSNPNSADYFTNEQMMQGSAQLLATVLVLGIWSWRVKIGKGKFSSICLLVAYLITIGPSLISGYLGWLIYLIYLIIFLVLVNAVRASWVIKKLEESISPAVFD